MDDFGNNRFLASVVEDSTLDDGAPASRGDSAYHAALREYLHLPSPFNSPPPLQRQPQSTQDTPTHTTGVLTGNVTPPTTPRPQINRAPSAAYSPPPGGSRSPQPSPVSSQCLRTPLSSTSPVSLGRMHLRSPFSTPQHLVRSYCLPLSHSRILDATGMSDGPQSISWGMLRSLLVVADCCVYRYTTDNNIELLLDGTADPRCIVSSVDQQYVAVGLEDGLIFPFHFFDGGITALPQIRDFTEPITAMHLSGSTLFVGTISGVVAVFELALDDGVQVSCIGRYSVHQTPVPVSAVSATNFGEHFAVSTQQDCRIYNRTKGDAGWSVSREEDTTAAAASCLSWFEGGSLGVALALGGGTLGSSVLVRSVGGSVFLSEDTGCEVVAMASVNARNLLLVSHGASVRGGHGWEVGVDVQGCVVAYSVQVGEACLSLTYKLKGHMSPPTNLIASGDEIVTGASGDDNTIRFWTLPTDHAPTFTPFLFDEIR